MSDLMGRLRTAQGYYDQSIPPDVIDGGGSGGAPSVSGTTPTQVMVRAATPITIHGANLNGTTDITFSGQSVTNLVVVDNQTITCTTPALPNTGPAFYILHNPNGDVPGLRLNVIGLSDVFPTTGPAAGGEAVTVNGFDFTTATGVTFGGVAATGFSTQSTWIDCTAPPHAAGAVDVVVQPFGYTLAGGFTYV